MQIIKTALPLFIAFAAMTDAYASCGASFCTVNTFSEVDDLVNQGGLRFGVRYEFINQDQPRHGRKRLAVGEIPQHHDEVRTINRNTILSLDYATAAWGFTTELPLLNRGHQHIHRHRGAFLHESWEIKNIGDFRLLGRYQYGNEVASSYGLNFGIKLPTGEFKKRNAQNELAERSLQPGSGTTDFIVGGYYNAYSEQFDWFMQALLQAPVNTRDAYRPGNKLGFDIGVSHALSNKTKAVLQTNTTIKSRDHGTQAEPANTGGTSISLSPGVFYKLTPMSQLYGFIQLPLYQRVNGVQLTADWTMSFGWKMQFK